MKKPTRIKRLIKTTEDRCIEYKTELNSHLLRAKSAVFCVKLMKEGENMVECTGQYSELDRLRKTEKSMLISQREFIENRFDGMVKYLEQQMIGVQKSLAWLEEMEISRGYLNKELDRIERSIAVHEVNDRNDYYDEVENR